MKMTTKRVHLWRTVEGWLANPGFAHLMGSLRFLGLGFLLSGASFFGSPMPVACALIATATAPIFALAGLLGAAVGYLYFWGMSGGLESLALGLLVFATVCTMGNSSLRKSTWFLPVLTSSMAALIGVLYLSAVTLSPAVIGSYLLKVCASGGLVYGFQMARRNEKSGYTLLFLGCCVAGCHGISLYGGFTLGHFLAFFLASGAMGTPVALPFAAVLGLALDCASGATFQMTALLIMAALLCQVGLLGRRPLGQLVLLTSATMFTLFAPDPILAMVPGSAIAICVGFLMPKDWFHQWSHGVTLQRLEEQLVGISHVFTNLSLILQAHGEKKPAIPMAAIFDLAAQEVCGNCPLWSQCWKQKNSETFRLFATATPTILERGAALREDFPPSFTGYCSDFSRLLSHINTSLDGISCKKQHQTRLQESRDAMVAQYDFLSDYCRTIGQNLATTTKEKQVYYPEVAVKSAKKPGNAISGDCASAFYCGETFYCVLLCDGMGSGQAAADEADLAVSTLRDLLQAGLPAKYALELLNHLYILRGTGCFSTVDLLWIDLCSAQAVLYKWGTAPSYCKGETTQKLGTTTPPPGLGVGEKHQALALTMEKGQAVVLLSDGIDGTAIARLIGGWRVCPPKELASAILAEAKTVGEDDMTAVVVTLRQRSSDF